ncbi:MAG: MobC family plasmid mobilization relaxosome protein [Acidobacteria bacterium]|nr:MobC family plasmid mobilization relaxosome protein [Acidobacteriota bacterium]
MSPSALLRMAMARTQTWTAPPLAAYRERSRQIARIGNNLNQVARWANTHAYALDGVRVMDRLTAVERALRALAPPDGADRGAH